MSDDNESLRERLRLSGVEETHGVKGFVAGAKFQQNFRIDVAGLAEPGRGTFRPT